MIRILTAFIWMRLRIFRNSLRKRSKQTSGSLARVFEVLSPILLALSVIPSMIGFAALGAFAGWWLGTHGEIPQWLLVLRFYYAVILILTLVAPFATAVNRSYASPGRLLLLPISRGKLHLAQVFSAVGDPVVFLALPPVLTLPAGLLVGGRPLAALIVLLCGLAFIAICLLVQSSASSGLQLIFRERGRSEWFMFIFVAGMISISFSGEIFERWAKEKRVGLHLPGVLAHVRGLFPSELYYTSVTESVLGGYLGALGAILGLAAIVSALFLLSHYLFSLLLAQRSGRRKTRAVGRGGRMWHIPGLSEGASAVAQSTIQSALRSARGRMSIYFSPFIVPLFAMGILFRESNDLQAFSGRGVLVALLAVAFSMMTVQPVLLNVFGVDRTGLTMQFLAPLTDRDIVLGKMVGVSVLGLFAASLGTCGGLIVERSGSVSSWLAVPVVAAAAYAVQVTAAVVLSILVPKASDLGRWGREGNPHPVAGLCGMLLVIPALGIPVALAATGLLLLQSQAWMWILLLAWTSIALAVAQQGSRLTARLLARNRENLLQVIREQ